MITARLEVNCIYFKLTLSIAHDARRAASNRYDVSSDFDFNRFRFNDISAHVDFLELRREVPVLCFGKRSTFNVNIPMVKEHVFSVPPYEIFKVSLLVELTTSAKTYVV